ncbi:MAG: serine/threonine-protein phosphatase [Oscillospiraceae bacterium]|nr:serine/threonine-protein phosphatase [Oscillospiraceae bacterium]MBP5239485.1 serine/threonine-protein phosphatase [Oscillospiraceae bacterium]
MPEPQQNANNELNQEIRINLIAARVLLAAAVLDLLLLLLTLMNQFPVSRGTMFAVLIPVFFLLLAAAVVFSASVKRNRSVIVEQEAEAQKTERLSMELELAKTIQSNMLPNTYPVFPERKEFDVYARTEPAKELGGDFFDFQMIDKDHLALIIADVAGKGIPAAMFMMASKIIIHNMAKSRNHDPAKILKAVNKQIGANNHADMFVTLWLGILEISTGLLSAANAGHEYPCLMHKNRDFILLKDPHGLVLGALDKTEYRSYEIQLVPGDTVFLYTDGVTEAMNADNEEFGLERMVDALNLEREAPVAKLVDNVRGAVGAFVGDAQQADDITMMVLRYFGEEGKPESGADQEAEPDADPEPASAVSPEGIVEIGNRSAMPKASAKTAEPES